MTNQLAITLGLSVLGLVLADYFFFDAANFLFLARKGFLLLDWLAFWR